MATQKQTPRRSQGSGSIVFSDGLYRGRADLGRDRRGRRSRRWTKGYKTRKEAERALSKLIAVAQPTTPSRVKSLLEDYIESRRDKGCERKTIERYDSLARNNIVPYIGTANVGTLRVEQVDQLYARLIADGLSKTTVFHAHGLLNAAFRWGVKKGRVDRNPMEAVDAPRRARSSGKAAPIDVVVAFMEWLPSSDWANWRPLFLFAVATGMRRGEMLALRRDRIDEDRSVILVTAAVGQEKREVYLKHTKTEHIREVPLSPLAREALDEAAAIRERDAELLGTAYENNGLVFADPFGRQIKPQAFTDAFRRARARAGLVGITLHSMRHTAGTLMISGGVDVITAGRILGHNDPTTTLRVYGHVVAGAQEHAVGVISDSFSRTRDAREQSEKSSK